MKNKLESFIREHKQGLDHFEPPADLWDKIASELDKKKGKKPVRLYLWASVAACVAVLFGLWIHTATTDQAAMDIADVSPLYAEKDVRFASQIAEKKDSLQVISESDPALYKEFHTDLKTLDLEYENLKKDLPASPNQELVVRAMVKNREMQLQILKQQLSVVNQINQYKNQKESSL